MRRFGMLDGAAIAGIAVIALVGFGCGGDGGGGGGPTSTIQGNVADSPGATLQRTERSWLAWLREDVLGFAKNAVAQSGVVVTARGGGRRVSDETASDGSFDIDGAPSGDVTVTFQDGDCAASQEIPSIGGGCVVVLEDVELNCRNVRSIARIGEGNSADCTCSPG